MNMPRTLYVEYDVLASSTQGSLWPNPSCRLAVLLVSTSFILMFLAPWANIVVLAIDTASVKRIFFIALILLYKFLLSSKGL